MKFYLADDLHLEFSDFRLPKDPEAILLLAGDICLGSVFKQGRTDQKALKLTPRFREFFETVSRDFKKVYWIAGNHEFYYGHWDTTRDFMREGVKDTNVTVLEKEWVDLGDDVHLYGATFWTDFKNNNPNVMSIARNYMNDYNLINATRDSDIPYAKREGTLIPQIVYDDHVAARAALEAGLAERKGKKVIVMTHHAPSMTSSHPRYGKTDNPVNWAYCSELDQFVMDNPTIRYWVHGHTHESHDYMLGGTRVICNPRGYSYRDNGVDENHSFKNDLSFEV